MKNYTTYARLHVVFTIQLDAEDATEAEELAATEYPGLPYIGEDWDEDGEPEFVVEES